MSLTISVVVVTYRREQVLLDTLGHVLALLQPGDEVVVIDQTERHEPATQQELTRLAEAGRVRWFHRDVPSIPAAMNAGAAVARGEVLLFLDDDVIPDTGLLEAHREAFAGEPAPAATCGQVLQPWHDGPVGQVRDFALGFDAAYSQPCEIATLMAGNFGIPRESYIHLGGMDENFTGPAYRLETEFALRLARRTGRKVTFLPGASLRHLKVSGGTRVYGSKDSFRHIGGSVGDYYFALRCLPWGQAIIHSLKRWLRSPVNRETVRRPWVIPVLYLRETLAWCAAAGRALGPPRTMASAETYLATTRPAPAAQTPTSHPSPCAS